MKTQQIIHENHSIKLAKASDKCIVFGVQGAEHLWNVFNPRNGYAMTVKSFWAACVIAGNWKQNAELSALENHASEVLARSIKKREYVN